MDNILDNRLLPSVACVVGDYPGDDKPKGEEMNWKWQVECKLCGYKSGWHEELIARVLSLLHTATQHAHGHNVIAAKK